MRNIISGGGGFGGSQMQGFGSLKFCAQLHRRMCDRSRASAFVGRDLAQENKTHIDVRWGEQVDFSEIRFEAD